MKRYSKYTFILALLAMVGTGCEKKEYTMGALNAPTEVMINTAIAGQSASMPNGDGSGNVSFTLTGKNVLSYKIDYDASDGISLQHLPTGKVTRKYTKVGTNTYRITVVAYGTGGVATTVTKDIQVRSDFTPDAAIVSNLVGSGTKTWKVDKDVAGHFGVGPWDPTSTTPAWWSASPNEKSGPNDNCIYTASYTFTRTLPANTFTLTVTTPDGAFTKTGSLAGGLPGIPGSGPEQCYGYAGGSSSFSFVPAGSGLAASASTGTSIMLGGNNTYIGYGAQQKEYEILSITATTLKLRAQGTETGNAWYLILKAN
jgi:hypothetical protein